MTTHSIPKNQSNTKQATIINYDPWRRLIAKFALYAVRDYLRPPKNLTSKEQQSAVEFVHSQVGQDLIKALGIPQAKISATLQTKASKTTHERSPLF